MMMGSTALPPEVPAARDVAVVWNLLALFADQAAAQARIDEYRKAADDLRQLLAEAPAVRAQLETERTEQARKLKADRAQHDAALASERSAFKAETAGRERDLGAREAELQESIAAAKRDREAAAELRRDLEGRLEQMNRLAGGKA